MLSTLHPECLSDPSSVQSLEFTFFKWKKAIEFPLPKQNEWTYAISLECKKSSSRRLFLSYISFFSGHFHVCNLDFQLSAYMLRVPIILSFVSCFGYVLIMNLVDKLDVN